MTRRASGWLGADALASAGRGAADVFMLVHPGLNLVRQPTEMERLLGLR